MIVYQDRAGPAFARIYNAAGQAVTDPFQVNQQSESDTPTVAMDAAGDWRALDVD